MTRHIFLMSVVSLSLGIASAHSEHKAHVHGEGAASLAFDGKKGKLELHLPSESVYGFEYAARSAKDRANKEKALVKLEEKISEMVVIDPASKCEIKKEIFEVIESKSHGDVEAEFSITCEQSPLGTTLNFDFAKNFPRLKKVKVDVLAGEVQKSVEVTKGGASLELK